MDWGKFFLSLNGRIGRKAFWLFTAALIVIYTIAAFAGGVTVDACHRHAWLRGLVLDTDVASGLAIHRGASQAMA